MKRLAILVVLAACGGKPAATTTVDVAPPADPPYAGMCQDGRVWTFDLVTVDAGVEHPGEAVCRVSRVEATDSGTGCTITCEGFASSDPLTGPWYTDDEGLYRIYGEDKELVLPARPVATSGAEHDNPDDRTEKTAVHEIRKDGTAWCWHWSAAQGDRRSLCFDCGDVTHGTSGWVGDTSYETRFTLQGAR